MRKKNEVTEKFDEIFERIRKALKVDTQTELADLLGVRQATVSETKRRKVLPAEWIIRLYRLKGINPAWLLDGKGPQKTPCIRQADDREAFEKHGERFPDDDSVGAIELDVFSTGDGGNSLQAWIPEKITSVCIPIGYFRQELKIFRMESANMEPMIRRGSLIGIDCGCKTIISNDIYGIYAPFEGITLKRIYNDAKGGEVFLRSDNPSHPDEILTFPDIAARMIGRVAWVLQEL